MSNYYMDRYYTKQVQDAYDDVADVSTLPFSRRVTLTAIENYGEGDDERAAYLSFTPRQAKRLAKALRKAAKAFEENA